MKRTLIIALIAIISIAGCKKKETTDPSMEKYTPKEYSEPKVGASSFEGHEIVKAPPPESLSTTDMYSFQQDEMKKTEIEQYQHGNPSAYGNDKFQLKPPPGAKFDQAFTKKASEINDKYMERASARQKHSGKIKGEVYTTSKSLSEVMEYYKKEYQLDIRDIDKDGPLPKEFVLSGEFKQQNTAHIRTAPVQTQLMALVELGEKFDAEKPEFGGNFKEGMIRLPGLGTIIVREKYIDPSTFTMKNQTLVIVTKEIK